MYAPELTDHNDSNPAVALLQLARDHRPQDRIDAGEQRVDVTQRLDRRDVVGQILDVGVAEVHAEGGNRQRQEDRGRGDQGDARAGGDGPNRALHETAAPSALERCCTADCVDMYRARSSGAGTRDFLKITLKEVLVTGIQMADNGDGPVEQITLSFGEIGFDYTPQTARGGAGTPVKVNWNVRTTQVT